MYKQIKRLFDIVIAITALVLVSPILLLTALCIKIESKGPIIYRSKRVGQHYRVFGLLKFRTMYVNADRQTELLKSNNVYGNQDIDDQDLSTCRFCNMLQRPCSPILLSDNEEICEILHLMRKEKEKSTTFYKVNKDPRVTRVGRLLRKTSIDELPQLINVIMGHMSLIGNRPLPLYEAEKLTTDYAIGRFNAPSGLTGLWQVTKRGKLEISQQERVNLDLTYARDWSMKTDLNILLKTFPALLQEDQA